MPDNEVTISIRCDEEREGQDRLDQLATIKAARRAAIVLGLSHSDGRQPHDEQATSVTVPEDSLDAFIVGMTGFGGDHKRVTMVHAGEDGVYFGLKVKLHGLFKEEQLDL